VLYCYVQQACLLGQLHAVYFTLNSFSFCCSVYEQRDTALSYRAFGVDGKQISVSPDRRYLAALPFLRLGRDGLCQRSGCFISVSAVCACACRSISRHWLYSAHWNV
jgi:hypothetical protein